MNETGGQFNSKEPVFSQDSENEFSKLENKKIYYPWDDERESCLIKLKEDNPKATSVQLAEKMNQKYPEGVHATISIINMKLRLIYKNLPELKKNSVAYPWDDERESCLIKLKEDNPKATSVQLAEMMNQKYPEGTRATSKIINARLFIIYSDHPELRKRNEFYPWDDERENYLIKLIEDNSEATYAQLAEMINHKYLEGVQAVEGIVRDKLRTIYKNRPELKKILEMSMPYPWDNERENYLIKLIEDNSEATYAQLAETINHKYPEGAQATGNSIGWKLTRIYKGKPELKKKHKEYQYPWDDERENYLIKLIEDNSEATRDQLVEMVNKKNPEGIQVTKKILENKLTRIFKKRSELKKTQERNEFYPWDDEREEHLIKLKVENLEATIAELVKMMNQKYPEGIKASKSIITDKLRIIYKNYPELRKRKKSDNKFATTKEEKSIPIILNPEELDLSIVDFNKESGFTTEIQTIPVQSTEILLEMTKQPYENELDKLIFGLEPTGAQKLRNLIGATRGIWKTPEEAAMYVEYLSQLAPYVAHRAKTSYLLNYFHQKNERFPQDIIDLGAGPSTGYLSYQELAPLFTKYGFTQPQVVDVDSSLAMLDKGLNPQRIQANIAKRLPIEDGKFQMVESSYVLTHLKPAEIFTCLSEANRITDNGGYLNLVCHTPFSKNFIEGVEKLGYQVISQHGERLAINQELFAYFEKQYGQNIAKRIRDKLNSAYFLFAKKTESALGRQIPAELFTFDQYQSAGLKSKNQLTEKPSKEILSEEELHNIIQQIEKLTYSVEEILEKIDSFDQAHLDFYKLKPTPYDRLDFKDHVRNEITNIREQLRIIIQNINNKNIDAEFIAKIKIIRLALIRIENFSQMTKDERSEYIRLSKKYL